MLGRALGAVDALGRAAAILAAVMVAALAVMVVAQIVANVFGADLGITIEYGAYILVLVVFAAAAEAARSGAHIRVSLVLAGVPASWRRALEIVSTAAAVATLAYIALALTEMAVGSLLEGSRSYLPSRTPLGVPQGLLAAGAWLLALQFAARLVRCIAGDAPDLDAGAGEIEREP